MCINTKQLYVKDSAFQVQVTTPDTMKAIHINELLESGLCHHYVSLTRNCICNHPVRKQKVTFPLSFFSNLEHRANLGASVGQAKRR